MSASPTCAQLDSGYPGSWWIFFSGLLIFIAFQTGLVLEVQLSRSLPPEADDAYRYIYNALQLREGFTYDTPALRDFLAQTKEEAGDSVDRQNLKWDVYHSLFMTHFLLHSALLSLISWGFGVSLDASYKISCVLGSLLISGAISYFLLTLTDRTSAGIALGSMALTMFPMQGIHYVVPTNMCMAVGLILMAIVLRTGGKAKWQLFWLSVILVFLHRMGILYAGLGVFISSLLRYRGESWKKIILDLLPTTILIIFIIIITHIFPLKIFQLSPTAQPPGTNYFNEVWLNSLELFNLIGSWFLDHGVIMLPRSLQNLVIYKLPKQLYESIINYRVVLLLALQILGLGLLYFSWLLRKASGKISQLMSWLIGLGGIIFSLPFLSAIVLIFILRAGWLYPPPEKKYSLHLAFFVLFFVLIPSIFHVMYIAEPGHPTLRADLTTRLWVPFAIVLAAIFGRGLWLVIKNMRSGSTDFLPSNVKGMDFFRGLFKTRTAWAALLIFLAIGYSPHLIQAYDERENIKHFMLIRQNVLFDKDQIKWIYENSTPQDIIVYDDDLIRHYFLSHGFLERRAAYLPLRPFPNDFNLNPKDIKYKISWNPFLHVQNYENVRAIEYPLIIPEKSVYTLTFEPHFQPDKIRMLPFFSPKGTKSYKLRIMRESTLGKITKVDINLTGNNWQEFRLFPEQGGSLSLVNLDPYKPVALSGLTFGGDQDHSFLWPWQGVVKVALNDKILNINRSAPLPREETIQGITFDLEVLQDHGSTVLWKVSPKKKAVESNS